MSTKTQAHTPGPWRVVFPVDSMLGYVYGPKHPDGGDYAPLFETGNRANAFLIVQAVNSHADLLAALTRLTEKAERVNAIQHSAGKIIPEDWSELYMLTNESRAAIAKAKGQAD